MVASHYVTAYQVMPDHSEAGVLADSALDALRIATERAAALHSHGQVVALSRQALDIGEAMAGDRDGIGVGWAFEHGAAAANALVEADQAERFARDGIAWYRERRDEGSALRLMALLGRVLTDDARNLDRTIAELDAIVGDIPLDRPELVSVATELARAHMLAGNADDALDVGVRASEAAERLDLIPEIVELLNTRGTVLGDRKRRLREGVALLRGALDLADANNLLRGRLRARVNLSYVQALDDPAAVSSILSEGLAIARSVSDRGFELTFAGNLSGILGIRGDFDGYAKLMDSLALELAPPSPRVFFKLGRLQNDAIIGDPDVALEEARRLVVELPPTDDPQVLRNVDDALAGIILMSGDAEEAHRMEMAGFAADPYSYPLPLLTAAAAAAWLRDLDRLEEVRQAFTMSSGKGRLKDAGACAVAGAIAALQGDLDTARERYGAVDDILVAVDASWIRALALAEFAHVAPGHPDAARAAALADELAAPMGAVGALERLRRIG